VVGPNLAPLAGSSLSGYGIPTLAAPFAFSVVLFVLAAVLLLLWLRPDPMRVALHSGLGHAPAGGRRGARTAGMRAALGVVLAHPAARLGVAAAAVGQVVMVGVMAMTPVHILSAGHGSAHTLRIVGVVLSLHVAGMYAFAPIMGWLADRFGQPRVILGGVILLLAACAVAGTSGHDVTRLALGLALLGLGWSAMMVAGSALLSESMSTAIRPSAQGLSDVIMGLAGASAGAGSGLVVQAWGYPMLTLLAALTTVPLIALAIRGGDRGGAGWSPRASPRFPAV
jgi:MFS family permease